MFATKKTCPAARPSHRKAADFARWAMMLLWPALPWPVLQAQESNRVSDPNLHAWYMYFGDHAVKEGPWGIHFDGQFRRQGVGQQWQQLLLRPGVNYDLTSQVQLSAGYAFIKSHPYGDYPAPFVVPEHRLWQQLLLKQRVRSAVAHRFRLEQRFVGAKTLDAAGEPYLTGYGYRNRFRYFVKGVVPIRNDGRDSRYFLALYNEVMFNFGRNVQNNIFDQNRAYVALGRKLPWLGNLEVGYLQQTVQQGNGRVFEFNHTLQVGLFSVLGIGRD
jgi:hypothetical protein